MNNILYIVQHTSHCQCVESPDTLPRLLNTNTHPQMLSRQWWKAAFFIETQNKPTLTNGRHWQGSIILQAWLHQAGVMCYCMVLCVVLWCYMVSYVIGWHCMVFASMSSPSNAGPTYPCPARICFQQGSNLWFFLLFRRENDLTNQRTNTKAKESKFIFFFFPE